MQSLSPIQPFYFLGLPWLQIPFFLKKLEKTGIILDIPEEKTWEKEKSMQAWIIDYAAKSGKKVDSTTALQLIKLVGTDTATLHQELEKLICFVGDAPTISAQDAAKLCAATPLDTIWQLG